MSETEDAANQVQWTTSIEMLLAKWCDEAKCFEWMHMEAYHYYDVKSRILIITSNVLTSVSGLVNLIVGGVTTQGGFQTAWIFGTISIIISITNMLQEKLSYTTLATEHKNYSMLWGIIRRKIEEELVIPPSSRKQCSAFLKFVREDINKVSLDGNTKIPEPIRKACLEKFGKIGKFEVPDICGRMEHTVVYVAPADHISTPLLLQQS
jgi:hypothetical protein